MLIALYYVTINVILPKVGAYASALFEPIMLIIITLAGIIMLLGAVGIKISNNLGATIVGGIFKSIGYLCRIIIQAIGWIARNTLKMLPQLFKESRKTFVEMGMNNVVSNLLAVMLVVLIVAIII